MYKNNTKYTNYYLLIATVNPAEEWAQGQITSFLRPFPSNIFTNESQAASDPKKLNKRKKGY